jgi:hypothetical protein
MSTLFAKNLKLSVPEHEFLLAESRRIGISENELIRRIIDEYRERTNERTKKVTIKR